MQNRAELCANLNTAEPPTAPVNITLTEVTSTSVHLGWSSPQNTNGTTTHYTIRCTQSDRDVWFSTSVTTSENVTSLQPFTNYTCCVSASNEGGEGERVCIKLPGEFMHGHTQMDSLDLII